MYYIGIANCKILFIPVFFCTETIGRVINILFLYKEQFSFSFCCINSPSPADNVENGLLLSTTDYTKKSYLIHTHPHTHKHSHSHTLSLTFSLTPSLTLSSHSHSISLSLLHSPLTLSHSHSFSLSLTLSL